MEAALVRSLEKLVKALGHQISILSDQILGELHIEKKKADEIQGLLKLLEKAQELADQYRNEQLTDSDQPSMREILNEIEERIENLAGQRVEQILSQECRSQKAGNSTEKRTAASTAGSTASAPR